MLLRREPLGLGGTPMVLSRMDEAVLTPGLSSQAQGGILVSCSLFSVANHVQPRLHDHLANFGQVRDLRLRDLHSQQVCLLPPVRGPFWEGPLNRASASRSLVTISTRCS